MTKSDIVAKLSLKHEKFRKVRNNYAELLTNAIKYGGLSEIEIGNYQKYVGVCEFYNAVMQKMESDGCELKDALFATTNEKLFEQSFISPRNPIQQGLYLYELEGYRMAILTIKKDFNL